MSLRNSSNLRSSGFTPFPISVSSDPVNSSIHSTPPFSYSKQIISPIIAAPTLPASPVSLFPLSPLNNGSRSFSPQSPYSARQDRPIILKQREVQFVEDTSKVQSLQTQLRIIAEQNKYFAAELASFQNRPPIIQEKIQFIEDTSKIDRLNRQFTDLLKEMENIHQKQFNKEEENSILKKQLSQLGNLHNLSEQENMILRSTIQEITDELSYIRASNRVLIQQNELSSTQIEELNGTVRQYLHELQKKSTLIEEKGKKIWGMENQLKAMNELKFNLKMAENSNKMKDNQCNELENSVNTLSSEGFAKEKQIQDLLGKLSEQCETTDCLQQSVRSLQETLSSSELLIHNQSTVIKQQIVEISDLTSKTERQLSIIQDLEGKNRTMSNIIETLEQEKEDMQIEIDHLESHEERLALLHKEIEDEKIFSLLKIKENDRLINLISKLEMQIKKMTGQREGCSPERLLTKEETTKRSKLAISQADSLKFLKNKIIETSEKDLLNNSIEQQQPYSPSRNKFNHAADRQQVK